MGVYFDACTIISSSSFDRIFNNFDFKYKKKHGASRKASHILVIGRVCNRKKKIRGKSEKHDLNDTIDFEFGPVKAQPKLNIEKPCNTLIGLSSNLQIHKFPTISFLDQNR